MLGSFLTPTYGASVIIENKRMFESACAVRTLRLLSQPAGL